MSKSFFRFLFLSSSFLFFQAKVAAEKANIVFFISDDMSYNDFGCYGHPVIKTPNIDKLAARGMRFDNAYLTTSSCSPSRCSIITGRYPHNTGAPELHSILPDDQIRFPELLRKAGYWSVLSGKNHMFGWKDRAFDEMSRGVGSSGSEDWLEVLKNRPKDKPFFFWFASFDGHRGWTVSDDVPIYSPDSVIVPPYLVDTKMTRQDLASYYHEVSRYDHFIGLIVDELEKQGVLDNTMIVVGTDNGRPFPRCKTRLYDSGIKSPWVVHFPKLAAAGSSTDSLISVIDLSATCLDLAGVEKPDAIQGISFVPILKNSQHKTREVVFAEHNWHVYHSHERMVRFGDYLYIKNNFPDQPNLGGYESDPTYPAGSELWKAHAAGKTQPEQQQIFASPCPAEELFHVIDDPHQLRNIAEVPEHQATLEKSRFLLAAWTKATGDTVPKNPTPHRLEPPRIENGEIIYPQATKLKERNPHREFPGAASNAEKIKDRGPVFIP
jgi:N-sulfoglucosamine sulfohydrolase